MSLSEMILCCSIGRGYLLITALTSTQPLDLVSLPSLPFQNPETYAMLLAGLGLLGFMGQRRKNLAR